MKNLCTTAVLISALSLSAQLASAACDYSNAASNGGWGWDDVANGSCPPSETTTGNDPDAGGCVYPGGDTTQWGWDNVALVSCAPIGTTSLSINDSNSSVPSNCVYPDGDTSKWGWDDVGRVSCPPVNNNSSNRAPIVSFESALKSEIVGSWDCSDRYLVPAGSFDIPDDLNHGCSIDPGSRGQSDSRCNLRWVATGYTTDQGNGRQGWPGLRWYDFFENGIGRVSGVSSNNDRYFAAGWSDIGWDVQDYQFSIDGDNYHRISFEVFNGQEYFSFNVGDVDRWTCKRR